MRLLTSQNLSSPRATAFLTLTSTARSKSLTKSKYRKSYCRKLLGTSRCKSTRKVINKSKNPASAKSEVYSRYAMRGIRTSSLSISTSMVEMKALAKIQNQLLAQDIKVLVVFLGSKVQITGNLDLLRGTKAVTHR